MAEIIDLLMPKAASCPSFTVDTGQKYVTASGAWGQMFNASMDRAFNKADNLIILSAGFAIQESFVLGPNGGGTTAPLSNVLYLRASKLSATPGPSLPALPGFGTLGAAILPLENYETAFNIFSNIQGLAIGENFCLVSILVPGYVSMIGVPAALHGQTRYLVPFVKVLHTLPMITE